MKRMTFLLAAASIALTLTACGTNATQDQPKPVRQTATAYLDQDKDTAVKVTVDLTGGWSVQFARGAVYLYEGEAAEDAESTAMLITLDQDAYDGHLADAMEDEERKETAEGIYFTPYEKREFLSHHTG